MRKACVHFNNDIKPPIIRFLETAEIGIDYVPAFRSPQGGKTCVALFNILAEIACVIPRRVVDDEEHMSAPKAIERFLKFGDKSAEIR